MEIGPRDGCAPAFARDDRDDRRERPQNETEPDPNGGEEMADIGTKRYEIFGRVTGVGFRAWTRRTAEAYAVTGWVRNRDDGSVEIVARGDEDSLRNFTEQIEIGPAGARVDDVRTESIDSDERFDDFTIVR